MDPLTQLKCMRVRISIRQSEKRLEGALHRRARLAKQERENAILMKAFNLGQVHRGESLSPFDGWNHPLADQLKRNFELGQGLHYATAA